MLYNMGDQVDIGFNTVNGKWFLEFSDEIRWTKGMQFVNNANLKIKNIVCDTFCWPDTKDRTSHGRLRYYDGEVESKGRGGFLESINVQSDNSDPIQFMVLHGKAKIKFNTKSMDWSIEIDGNNYISKNIIGKLSGGVTSDPIRFILDDAQILYSTIVTLINCNLQIIDK